MAEHSSSRSPRGAATIRKAAASPAEVTDIIPFNEFGDLHELDFRDSSAFDKEQRVMSMYYFDGMTMKEIGAILGISESRVCQVHSQVIKLLRQRHNRDEGLGRRAA